MITDEQRVLLESEKKKLLEIIEPAMKHFRESVGAEPIIETITRSNRTDCGVITHHEVIISINL